MAEEYFCDCGLMPKSDLPDDWGIKAPNRDEFEPHVIHYQVPHSADPVICSICGTVIRVRWTGPPTPDQIAYAEKLVAEGR
jgi:hypothetical protein